MLKRTLHGMARCSFPGGCTRQADDAHELLSRARGGSIVDPANIALLCREHHDWIGDHPADAAAMGLALSDNPCETSAVSDNPEPADSDHSVRLAVRISPDGDALLGRLERDTGARRSTVVRAMLKVAAGHERDVIRLLRQLPAERS